MHPQKTTPAKAPRTKRGFSVPGLAAFPVDFASIRKSFAAKYGDTEGGSSASTPRSKSSAGARIEEADAKDSRAFSADSLIPVEKSESKTVSQKPAGFGDSPSPAVSTLGLIKRRLSISVTLKSPSSASASSASIVSPTAGSEVSEGGPRITKEAGVYTLDFRSDPAPSLSFPTLTSIRSTPGPSTTEVISTAGEEGAAGERIASSPTHSRSISADRFSFSDSHILSPRNRKFICTERLMWESGGILDAEDAAGAHSGL